MPPLTVLTIRNEGRPAFVYSLKMGSGSFKNRGARRRPEEDGELQSRLPAPSASYRRRAWVEFQRALDPLAPVKPLRTPRS